MDASSDPARPREKRFPCESCGAQLTFSIGAQKLQCDHCGAVKELTFEAGASLVEHDLESMLQRRVSTSSSDRELTCRGCGATVVFSGSLTSSACSYCGGPLQVENAHQAKDRLRVDGICPFAVERATAEQHLKRWVESRWFAPTEFRRRGVTGRFDGVYIPYFTFDAMTFTRYQGQRGDAYYEKERHGDEERQVRKVRWSSKSGTLQRFFDDVCVPALRSLPEPLLRQLEPWPLGKLIPFTDQALAGMRAHTYEIDLAECFQAAKKRIDSEIHSDVKRDIGGDEQRVGSVDTKYTALTCKHVLLPAWMLAYRFQEKPYRVVVNAMTGEVEGERPWSAVKIAFAVLALVLAVLTVFYGPFGAFVARILSARH